MFYNTVQRDKGVAEGEEVGERRSISKPRYLLSIPGYGWWHGCFEENHKIKLGALLKPNDDIEGMKGNGLDGHGGMALSSSRSSRSKYSSSSGI